METDSGERKGTPTPAAEAAGDPWSGLLQTGFAMLEQLAAATHQGEAQSSRGVAPGVSFIHRDDRTGENFFKIPVPGPEVLDRVLGAVERPVAGKV